MRVLGIDLGSVRTGLALSDPHGVTCTPLEVLEERNEEQLLQKIVQTVEQHEVTQVVVGLPRPLSGGTNPQSEQARLFAEALSRRLSVPVVTWDERFTSKLAERGMIEGKAKGPRDAVAACHMLQSYLDFLANRRKGA